VQDIEKYAAEWKCLSPFVVHCRYRALARIRNGESTSVLLSVWSVQSVFLKHKCNRLLPFINRCFPYPSNASKNKERKKGPVKSWLRRQARKKKGDGHYEGIYCDGSHLSVLRQQITVLRGAVCCIVTVLAVAVSMAYKLQRHRNETWTTAGNLTERTHCSWKEIINWRQSTHAGIS